MLGVSGNRSELGHEVHPRALKPFFDDPLMRASAAQVLNGLPFSVESIAREETRVRWDDFAVFMERTATVYGGLEALEKQGETGPLRLSNRATTRIVRRFVDPTRIYWALMRWYAPSTFRNLHFTYESVSADHVRVTMEIPDRYCDCPPFFHAWKGVFRAAPSIMGLSHAIVDAEISPRRAVYSIALPPAQTVLHRLRSGLRAIVSAHAAIEELTARENELLRAYDDNVRTQRLAAEQELRLKLAAQLVSVAKLSALGEMAAGVAHEINNPLQAITAAAGVIRSLVEDADTPDNQAQIEDGIRAIEKAARRAAEVTYGLLAFARDASSDPPKPVPAKRIVEAAFRLSRKRFQSAGIALSATGEDEGLSIRCRETQIVQVILNLLGNAFDACQPLTKKWVRVELAQRNSDVEIAVVDSGTGISADIREKMFQPFFSTKGIGKGTGLGLSVARGIVASNGGSLEIADTRPHTTFIARFPAASLASNT